MNQELGSLGSFTIDSNNHIYAGSNYWGRGMYKSTNNGFDWQVINNGIKNSFITSLTQAVDSTIWAGTWGNGLFYSVNSGSDWNYAGMATKKVSSIELDYNNNIFIATSEGLYFSSDNGTDWIDKSVGMPNRRFEDLIIIDSSIYAGTFGNGLYKSSNNGNSWTKISYSLPSQTVYKLAKLNEYLLCGTSSGIYKTSDDGTSWELFFSIKPEAIFVTSDDDIYVGTTYDGAFLSRDKGQTWISLTGYGLLAGMVNTFGEDLVGNIYAGTYMVGVYVTLDDGNTWSKLNDGLPYLDIHAFLSSLDGYMYAGTIGGGLYRSIDPISSIKSGENNFNLESFTLSQNYPNPFNPSTVISYQLPVIGFVTLKVYNILGREIATLVNEEKPAGEYKVEFNGNNLPSGIYFYQLKAGSFAEIRKMVLLK
jgi:ligand-binding sensor domain-containing protein